MRLVQYLVLLLLAIITSFIPAVTAFRIDVMISKFIGKHLPDYTYSVPGTWMKTTECFVAASVPWVESH